MEEYNEVFGKEERNTEQDKCPACGANMSFDPGTQTLYCEHCGTHIEIERDKNIEEIAIEKAFDEGEKWNDETTVVRCENCGATVVMEAGTVAKSCPFCGASHVVETDEIPGIKPNVVIPFKFTEDDAVKTCTSWAKKKLFAPTKFKKRLNTENVSGLYFPCFTFDSNTFSAYQGRLGKYYTVTVGTGKNRRTVTKVRYFYVKGDWQRLFDDVTIAVSERINQKLMNKFMPFDYTSACVYDSKFLSGFMANHYEKDIHTSWKEAKDGMDAVIRQEIIRSYNADVVDYLNISTTHQNVTYKYVLLPVYVGNYRFKKKLYNFYMNGSTGKVVGKYPLSAIKVGIAALLAAGILTGIIFLIKYIMTS